MCCTMGHVCQCNIPTITEPLIQCAECGGYTAKDNKDHYLRHERERSVADSTKIITGEDTEGPECVACFVGLPEGAMQDGKCNMCGKDQGRGMS